MFKGGGQLKSFLKEIILYIVIIKMCSLSNY